MPRLMSDDSIQLNDIISATRTAADCVSAEGRPSNVVPMSSAAAEPVDERATKLGVERAVEKEVESEVGQLQRVENHPREHHRLLVDGRRLAKWRQMNDEVKELAGIDEHDQHHDDRHQRRVESVARSRSAYSLWRFMHHQRVAVGT